MIEIIEVTDKQNLEKVFAIREKVFVEEQNVSRADEYDEFENTAHHYLALCDGKPCGAARWRITGNGVKLERFAVLADYRNNNVGSQLLSKLLADIKARTTQGAIYLHAQLPAMNLYRRAGFEKQGALFLECDIKHYKMVLLR